MIRLTWKKLSRLIPRAVLLIAIIAGALWLGHFARQNEVVRELFADYGYGGVFVISVIAGFNLLAPVPAVSFLPLFLESGLDFWITLSVITVGTTIADSVAYFIGRVGRDIVMTSKERSAYRFLLHFKANRWLIGFLLFLYAAFVPLPNEILAVPLGFLGYRLRFIFPVLLFGNSVFNLAAGAGLAGLFQAV